MSDTVDPVWLTRAHLTEKEVRSSNIRSGTWIIACEQAFFFSEERESKATLESAVRKGQTSLFETADSRVAIISRSSEKRTSDRRLHG